MEDLGTSNKEQRRRSRQRQAKVLGGVLGATMGAGMGALAAGPPGAVVGVLVGSAMGAVTAWAANRGANDAADRDSQLDIDIGVLGPDLGAPTPEHPRSETGAVSRAASGAGQSAEDGISAEGPIQPPPW